MGMDVQDKRSGRRGYVKPELRSIDLVAEEVLGVGCKMASSSGPDSDVVPSGVCTTTPCFSENS